jgi:hypothetical protein
VYVSELQQQTGLLFIPQVIYEQEEPWWNYIHMRILLIRPTELSGSPYSSHLVANQKKLGEGNNEFGLLNTFLHTSK